MPTASNVFPPGDDPANFCVRGQEGASPHPIPLGGALASGNEGTGSVEVQGQHHALDEPGRERWTPGTGGGPEEH